jgi:uncharacterized protein DUF1189
VRKYLLIFLNSIRGFQSYQYLFRNPLRVTLTYWFMVSFALALTVVVIRYFEIKRELPTFTAEIAKNLPDFSFRDGETVTSAKTPVIVRETPVPIVLDPADTISNPPPEFTNGMFHIGKTKIKVWQQDATEPQIVPIKGFPDGKVDRDYLFRHGTHLSYILAPLLFVLLTLLFFVIGLLQALFFATLVSFLEKTIQPSFTFDEMLNISIYALTPGSLIVLVYWAVGVPLIPRDLIYFLAYIIFHVLASAACRRSMMPPSPELES